MAVSVTGASDALTISGAIGETGGAQTLTKTGSGKLTLSGPNNYTGATLISTGTLVAANATALGTTAAGTTVNSGATLDVQANIGTEAISVGGSGVGGLGALRTSTGTGTVGGAVTLTADTNMGGAGKLNISGSISATTDTTLAKVGTGVLNLSGQYFSLGNDGLSRYIQVNQGTVKFNNAGIYAEGIFASGNDVNIVATNSTIDAGDGYTNDGRFGLWTTGLATASFDMKGGSLTFHQSQAGGYSELGMGTGNGGGNQSIVTLDTGAVLNLNNNSFINMGDNQGQSLGTARFVLRSGTVNVNNTSGITIGIHSGENVFDQLGGSVNVPVSGALTLQFRMGVNDSYSAQYNLDGGTLTTANVVSGDAQSYTSISGGTSRAYFNFHGGTLQAAANETNFFKTTISGTYTGNAAPKPIVWSEGAVIDTNGNNVTIQQPLVAPEGSGVYGDGSRALTVVLSGADRGSGYQATPLIRIGSGISGNTAVAIANMEDDGTSNGTFRIASITITNPGTNYSSAPTVTIQGGTPTLAATAPTLTTASNLSGGLTKNGLGTLTLSAANTFSGDTIVNGGVLALSNNLALQNSALDTSGTGTVTLSVTTPTLGGLKGSTNLSSVITVGYGSVTALTLNPGTGVSNTYSGIISDGFAGMTLTKTGLGTQVLSGPNTYTGLTAVNQGILSFSSAAAGAVSQSLGTNGGVTLGAAASSGTLQYTGGPTGATLDKAITVLGNGNDTIQNSGSGPLSLSGGITGANTSLTITGGADTTISSTVNLGGVSGALTKSGGGLLNIDSGNPQTYKTLTTMAGAGTTNVNSTLSATGGTDVIANGKIKFGSVSQTLNSLTIGAGATVVFTSGAAVGSFSGGGLGGGKALSLGGSAVVPEPGTLGLLLVGALGVLHRRRRQP